ncbi:UNVERIFIED_CONTAM: hypothetical protein FKN15_047421 [Acipenser sinensis]
MVVLKTLRPEGAGFGSPFGLGLFPELQRAESGDNPPSHQKGIADSKPAVDQLKKGSTKSIMTLEAKLEEFPVPNYNLHVFYYSWYGSPQFDGRYIHWDHPVLSHWDPKVATNFPKGRHSPPDDVGSNFYPGLGAYSSRDPTVIEAHMQQLRTAAIGVLALSWYPPGMKDDNGESTDDLVPAIMDIAHKYQVKRRLGFQREWSRDQVGDCAWLYCDLGARSSGGRSGHSGPVSTLPEQGTSHGNAGLACRGGGTSSPLTSTGGSSPLGSASGGSSPLGSGSGGSSPLGSQDGSTTSHFWSSRSSSVGSGAGSPNSILHLFALSEQRCCD